MAAVVEHRGRLQALARGYVEQASRFLGGELDHIADQSLRSTAQSGMRSIIDSLQGLGCDL